MSINATYSKSYNTSRLLKRKRFLRPIIIRLEIFDFISRMAVVVKKFGISSNDVTKCEEFTESLDKIHTLNIIYQSQRS